MGTFSGLCILSPYADVLLLLIYFYVVLEQYLKEEKGQDIICEIDCGQAYEALTPKYASTLVGFHKITGCDITGKFNGKSSYAVGNNF